MENQRLAEHLFDLCGGSENVELAENCMTRLRVVLKDSNKADFKGIKSCKGVLGLVGKDEDIQIVIGPGKVAKVTKIFNSLMDNKNSEGNVASKSNILQDNKLKKNASLQTGLKKLSQIFIPLIPGIMGAGLLLGISSILNVLVQQNVIPDSKTIVAITKLCGLLGNGCLSFLCIFVGINSAKVFKCTTILGGLIGGLVILEGVTEFAAALNDMSLSLFNVDCVLYNSQFPTESLLTTGKGGVIGVVIGVWILSKVENWLHKRIPDNLDLIIVPLVSILTAGILMLVLIMPLAGLLSSGVITALNFLGETNIVAVKIIYGFTLGATFLPMVMLGLHQSLVPIYVMQVDTLGYITILAAQMMSGGANIGAAICIYIKAKRIGHKKLQDIIRGSLPTAILGIHEPLIYGMTMPIAISFVPIGIGAGIGGVWCVLMNVYASSYGPATLLGVTTMLPECMLNYLIGLVISCVASLIFTHFIVSKRRIQIHKDALDEG